MNNTYKNIIYSIVLVIVISMVYIYRQAQKPVQIQIQGETMGTYYKIIYLDPQSRRLQKGIDSVLQSFNASLSTYIKDSEISRFNRQKTWKYKSNYFYPVLKKSQEVFNITQGAFDPTVMPLVRAWGFAEKPEQLPDSLMIDSLMQTIGFDKISFDKKQVRKKVTKMQLDFSAIAKGYGVDVIAEFLESNGIDNYLIEIGGELVGKGTNEQGEVWRVGINPPQKQSEYNDLIAAVKLENRAMATSGNYRNYYKVGNKVYVHTLNPKTGFPVEHTLLSASVFASDCMTADAFATAFMVMGFEKSKELINTQERIEGFLVYLDEKGIIQSYYSKGLEKFVLK